MTLYQIKAEYLRGDCKTAKIIKMLQEHCGMSLRQAEDLVDAWKVIYDDGQ